MSYSEVTELLGKPQYNFGSGWVREVYVLNGGYLELSYDKNDEGALKVIIIKLNRDIWRNFLYWFPNLLILLVIIFAIIISVNKLIRNKQVEKSPA